MLVQTLGVAVASTTLRPDLDDPARLQSLKHSADHRSRVHGTARTRPHRIRMRAEGAPKPQFESGLAQYVETQVDEPTYLHCRVRNHDKYKVGRSIMQHSHLCPLIPCGPEL